MIILNKSILSRFFLYTFSFLSLYVVILFQQPSLTKEIILEIFVYINIAWIISFISAFFSRKIINISISLLLSLPILIILGLEFLSFFIQGQSFNDAFFFHTRFDVIETGVNVYWSIISVLTGSLFLLILIDIIITKYFSYPTVRLINIILVSLLFVLVITILPNSPKRFFIAAKSYYTIDSNANFIEVSKKLESYGVRTSALSQSSIEVIAPPQPKNLVLIYLESLERSYTDEKIFPNLVPNIVELQKSALDFTNLQQLPGTHFTIAGQMAASCGIPLIFGNGADIYYLNSLAKVNCIGDVLKKLNYYQVFMHGARLKFGATGTFFKSHGYNEVLGYDELVTPELLSEKYIKGWGLYDDTLFELASNKYNELSKTNLPFMLALATIDSHDPIGEPSKSCSSYSSKATILNAVHCTDYLLNKFINKIKENPAYQNTLIFILSDHLARKTDVDDLYPKNISDRKLLAFALNSEKQGKIEASGAHFDISHTILDLMGIKTNSNFFLGQSLLQPIQPSRYNLFSQKDVTSLIKQFFYLADEREQHNFCNNQGVHIADLEKATITLGDRTVIMSYKAGMPALPITEYFIAKLGTNGNIKVVSRYTYLNMMEMIRSDPKAVFFILTKQCKIPFGLIPDAYSNCGKWLWYMGTPSNLSGISGALSNLDDLKISSQMCIDTLKQAKQSIENLFTLRDIIEKNSIINVKEDFTFQIPNIKYKDQLYSTTFEKLQGEEIKDMIFRLKEVEQIK